MDCACGSCSIIVKECAQWNEAVDTALWIDRLKSFIESKDELDVSSPKIWRCLSQWFRLLFRCEHSGLATDGDLFRSVIGLVTDLGQKLMGSDWKPTLNVNMVLMMPANCFDIHPEKSMVAIGTRQDDYVSPPPLGLSVANLSLLDTSFAMLRVIDSTYLSGGLAFESDKIRNTRDALKFNPDGSLLGMDFCTNSVTCRPVPSPQCPITFPLHRRAPYMGAGNGQDSAISYIWSPSGTHLLTSSGFESALPVAIHEAFPASYLNMARSDQCIVAPECDEMPSEDNAQPLLFGEDIMKEAKPEHADILVDLDESSTYLYGTGSSLPKEVKFDGNELVVGENGHRFSLESGKYVRTLPLVDECQFDEDELTRAIEMLSSTESHGATTEILKTVLRLAQRGRCLAAVRKHCTWDNRGDRLAITTWTSEERTTSAQVWDVCGGRVIGSARVQLPQEEAAAAPARLMWGARNYDNGLDMFRQRRDEDPCSKEAGEWLLSSEGNYLLHWSSESLLVHKIGPDSTDVTGMIPLAPKCLLRVVCNDCILTGTSSELKVYSLDSLREVGEWQIAVHRHDPGLAINQHPFYDPQAKEIPKLLLEAIQKNTISVSATVVSDDDGRDFWQFLATVPNLRIICDLSSSQSALEKRKENIMKIMSKSAGLAVSPFASCPAHWLKLVYASSGCVGCATDTVTICMGVTELIEILKQSEEFQDFVTCLTQLESSRSSFTDDSDAPGSSGPQPFTPIGESNWNFLKGNISDEFTPDTLMVPALEPSQYIWAGSPLEDDQISRENLVELLGKPVLIKEDFRGAIEWKVMTLSKIENDTVNFVAPNSGTGTGIAALKKEKKSIGLAVPKQFIP